MTDHSPRAPATGRLVDHFEYGLDAPICLTWELHLRVQPRLRALPELVGTARPGRADHRRGQGADRRVRADADLLRQHRRRRADRAAGLLGAARLRRGAPRRREVLDQRVPDHPRAGRGSSRRRDYVDVQISLDGATAEVNDRGPRRQAPTTRRCGRWRNLQAAGMRDFKMSVVCTRHNIGQLDEFKAIADRYGAQLRLTRLRPSGRGADVWERAAPAARAAARALRLAGGQRRRGAHRRLVLPPVGVRRRAAGAEPLRRRTRRLPGRPGRGRVRVSVRHPRHGSRPASVRGRRASATVWSDSAAVRGAALPADRRRVHEVLGVRLLPGRLHGREVLHRPAARRTGPRVREGQRRGRARCRGGPPGTQSGPLAHRNGPYRAGAADAAAPSAPTGPATRTRSPVAR